MKNIMLILMMMLTISIFSQEIDWCEDDNIEEFLYSWDVEVDAWIGVYEDGTVALNLEDVYSENWYDVRQQLSTVLYAFHDEMEWQDLSVDGLPMDLIIYSWFEYNDPCDSNAKYNNEDLRWDIYIDADWLAKYFSARRDKDRTSMASLLVDSIVLQWEEANDSLIVRDAQPLQDQIIEQQQLQDFYLEDSNIQKKR